MSLVWIDEDKFYSWLMIRRMTQCGWSAMMGKVFPHFKYRPTVLEEIRFPSFDIHK